MALRSIVSRENALTSPAVLGLTQPALFGFPRIATNARILTSPLPVPHAIAYIGDWLAQPTVDLLVPGTRHLPIALGLLEVVGTAANLTTDVQLAAYALEHDAEIYSNGTDFARFPGVKWVDPLQ